MLVSVLLGSTIRDAVISGALSNQRPAADDIFRSEYICSCVWFITARFPKCRIKQGAHKRKNCYRLQIPVYDRRSQHPLSYADLNLIMPSTYNPPLVLTIIGTIFIGSALLVALWILLDICLRKGWQSMMAVMLVSMADFSYYSIIIINSVS